LSGGGAARRPSASLKGRIDGPRARRKTPTALFRKERLAMIESNLKTVFRILCIGTVAALVLLYGPALAYLVGLI